MTTVGKTGTAGATALDASEGAGRPYISGDYVLDFARVRVKQTEANLSRLLGNMKTTSRETECLNEVLKWCAAHAEGWGNPSPDEGEAKKFEDMQKAAVAEFKRMAEMAPPGSALKERLLYMADNPNSQLNTNAAGGSDNYTPKTDIDAIAKEFEGYMKAADRRTSEDQLYINKYMGDRNEVMQLASMLIQSFHETQKTILGRG